MTSYEKEIEEKLQVGKGLPERLHFSLLKYFWQANPLIGRSKGAIPYFLRRVEILKNFSEFELRDLANYLHLRAFEEKETIFQQGDRGIGFYFVLSGEVSIQVLLDDEERGSGEDYRTVVKLHRYDHFGELALLQENHVRNVWAQAMSPTLLLGLFRPDMEDLINSDPVVGAKLLQSLGVLLANRLNAVTAEMTLIKRKMGEQVRDGKNL